MAISKHKVLLGALHLLLEVLAPLLPLEWEEGLAVLLALPLLLLEGPLQEGSISPAPRAFLILGLDPLFRHHLVELVVPLQEVHSVLNQVSTFPINRLFDSKRFLVFFFFVFLWALF